MRSQIAYVLGTRPEIIKMSSLIAASQREGIGHSVIHTNQHYAESMDRVIFEQLDLPPAGIHLGVGSAPQGEQIGRMLCGLAPALAEMQPDIVVVQGDTNSALAGALAASKLGIPVAHVEAGLRSGDRRMPEEINRILIDQMADHLFCPTPLQAQILRDEGVSERRIHVTGNTVVDATLAYAPAARQRSDVLRRLGLPSNGYWLLTCHRRSNTEEQTHFERLMDAVCAMSWSAGMPLVFPMHPRLAAMGRSTLAGRPGLLAIEPVGYLDMLALLQGAALVMTDSGGVQEEACILQRKCLLLRTSTERPETLERGGAELPASLSDGDLRTALEKLLARAVAWSNPLGDGNAFRRILDILLAKGQEDTSSPRHRHHRTTH